MTQRVIQENSKSKKPLDKPRSRWEDGIKKGCIKTKGENYEKRDFKEIEGNKKKWRKFLIYQNNFKDLNKKYLIYYVPRTRHPRTFPKIHNALIATVDVSLKANTYFSKYVFSNSKTQNYFIDIGFFSIYRGTVNENLRKLYPHEQIITNNDPKCPHVRVCTDDTNKCITWYKTLQ